MTLNGVMAITLRYFTEFGKPALQKAICGGIYARVYIVFLLCVQCCRKESSHSLSHLLMSFLFMFITALFLSVVYTDGVQLIQCLYLDNNCCHILLQCFSVVLLEYSTDSWFSTANSTIQLLSSKVSMTYSVFVFIFIIIPRAFDMLRCFNYLSAGRAGKAVIVMVVSSTTVICL